MSTITLANNSGAAFKNLNQVHLSALEKVMEEVASIAVTKTQAGEKFSIEDLIENILLARLEAALELKEKCDNDEAVKEKVSDYLFDDVQRKYKKKNKESLF